MRLKYFATMDFTQIIGSVGGIDNTINSPSKLAHSECSKPMKQQSQTIHNSACACMEECCGASGLYVEKTATGSCGSLKRKRKREPHQTNHSPHSPKNRRKIVSVRNPDTPRLGSKQKAKGKRRGEETIRKTIMMNPKYKTMRAEIERIAKYCAKVERCPICSHQFEIDGEAIRTAIDHLHEMEDHEVICAFRALLCQRCNTTEGQALKESLEKGSDHVEAWMRKRFGGELTPKSKNIVRPRMESLLSKGRSITPILFNVAEVDD